MPINSVAISGNLCRDAELRNTGNSDVLNFSVAVNERFKNKQTGEWEDNPSFFDCALFGNRATAIAPYMFKGTKVSIHGKLRQSKWQDKNGENRYSVSIIVDEVEFMSQRQDGAQNAPQQAAPPMQQGYYQAPQAYQQPTQYTQQATIPMTQPANQPIQGQFQTATVYDQDIPF